MIGPDAAPLMGTTGSQHDEAAFIRKEFEEFLHIISHDLGAPLRAVVEFSRLLEEEHRSGLNEEACLYLSLVKSSGEKMAALLASLLLYSRLGLDLSIQPGVDCVQVINKCCQTLNERILSRGAKIEITELPMLSVDNVRFNMLWEALLANALTFCPAERSPVISIEGHDNKEGFLFSISDNGIGIEARHYERIFKPFQRLNAEGKYPGLGMGLTIAKKIVMLHKGRIWVEPSHQRGTSIKFLWPKEYLR